MTKWGHSRIAPWIRQCEKRFEKDTWTAGFKYSWRKMEAAAQDRAGWTEVPMFHWERQGV